MTQAQLAEAIAYWQFATHSDLDQIGRHAIRLYDDLVSHCIDGIAICFDGSTFDVSIYW